MTGSTRARGKGGRSGFKFQVGVESSKWEFRGKRLAYVAIFAIVRISTRKLP